MKKFLIALFCFSSVINYSQCENWEGYQLISEDFTNPINGISITAEMDKINRPYLYLASTTSGLKVYDMSVENAPVQIEGISLEDLDNLNAINLLQVGSFLYVTLGDLWDGGQESGLAIIDIEDPTNMEVLDVYKLPNSEGGAGDVKVVGNTAYLAAMNNGLLILDIEDKTNIELISQLELSIDYPHSIQGGTETYNARGIDITETHAFICYDRGGLRVIDITDSENPEEISNYIFAPLIDHATAYNNIHIENNIAYVALDYYGIEILDISNPNIITQLSWWKPNTWPEVTNDLFVWAGSNGHTNEITINETKDRLFISAGKSEIIALNVSDPYNPALCEIYGSIDNNYGTWGLDYYNGRIYATYIWAPFTPPFSNFTGFRELEVDVSVGVENVNVEDGNLLVFPNPTNNYFQLQGEVLSIGDRIEVLDMYGKLIIEEEWTTLNGIISIGELSPGLYQIIIKNKSRSFYCKKIVVK